MGTTHHPNLPAWFTTRMMHDAWSFGLLLTTGQLMVIERITDIHTATDGSLWLDVIMAAKRPSPAPPAGMTYLLAPTKRREASVNAAQVVAAFELADNQQVQIESRIKSVIIDP